MISLTGTLSIKAFNGRNGRFCTGELTTAIGEFKVKDRILEQFEPGEYGGTFLIEKIYPHCAMWYGRAITEIRAKLADITLDADEPQTPPAPASAPAEPDPADEETPAASMSLAPMAESPASSVDDTCVAVTAPKGPVDEWIALFGDELATEIAAGRPIKLDPTVGDRTVFRTQRDMLKSLNYKFQASTQTWVR